MKVQYLLLCLAIFVLGAFSALSGMDKKYFHADGTFARTGKQRYAVGWRVPDERRQGGQQAGWQNSFNLVVVSKIITLREAERVVRHEIGNDINNPMYAWVSARDCTYYYPIEAAIFYGTENTAIFEALLNAGVPPNGYQDYSPLKDILLRLAFGGKNGTTPEMLFEFLKILIDRGASLDIQLPDHIGFGPDTSLCQGCTARQLLGQIKGAWKNRTISWNIINQEFKKVPVPAISTSQPQSQGQISTTSSASSSISSSTSLGTGDDTVFEPSGTRYDELDWNYVKGNNTIIGIYGDYDPVERHQLWVIMARNNIAAVKRVLTENKTLWPLNAPSIITAPTIRTPELTYLYPLEYAIKISAPATTLRGIFELGSHTIFRGYDPFKQILDLLVNENDPSEDKLNLYVEYINTLLKYHVNPQASTLGDTSKLRNYGCARNASALTCVDRLIVYYQREQSRLSGSNRREQYEAGFDSMPNKIKLLQTLQQTFENYKPIASVLHVPAPQQQSAASSASTSSIAVPLVSQPTIAQPQATPPMIGSQPQPTPTIAWADTISRWCNEPKSGFAKTGACIFALAVVAVASKIVYNRFMAKRTDTPTHIMITNDSGSAITIGYKTKTSNELMSKTLKPEDDSWMLDMNQIKLDLIVTELETARKPLYIELGNYKAFQNQQHKTLHITIYRNAGLRYFWSRIPYTYTATWQ